MMDRPELGSAILRCRSRRGMSQETLGWKVGLSQATISRIERGECDPHPSDLRRLEKALDLPDGALGALTYDASSMDVFERMMRVSPTAYRCLRDTAIEFLLHQAGRG